MKQQPNADLPEYMVSPKGEEGQSHTRHRNYLLPVGTSFEDDKENMLDIEVLDPQSSAEVEPVNSSTGTRYTGCFTG